MVKLDFLGSRCFDAPMLQAGYFMVKDGLQWLKLVFCQANILMV